MTSTPYLHASCIIFYLSDGIFFLIYILIPHTPQQGPSSFHIDVAEYLLSASPAAVSLFHRVRMNLDSFGLAVTQHMMDEMRPGAGTGGFMECAREGAQCLPIPPCAAADGTYTVRYGLTARKTTTVKGITLPASCNVHTFKSDPVPGAPKNCWVECGAARALPVTTNAICPAVTAAPHASAGAKHRLPHVSDAEMHWATIPLCEEDVTTASGSVKEEAVLQEAIGLMCKHDTYKAAFKNVRLDCRFAAAYSRAIANAADTDVDGSRGAGGDSDSGRYQTVVHTAADYTTWIERAWVTYFKGTATGMNHVMMVSNLIRSAQMFSKYPLICVVFGQVSVSVSLRRAAYARASYALASDACVSPCVAAMSLYLCLFFFSLLLLPHGRSKLSSLLFPSFPF